MSATEQHIYALVSEHHCQNCPARYTSQGCTSFMEGRCQEFHQKQAKKIYEQVVGPLSARAEQSEVERDVLAKFLAGEMELLERCCSYFTDCPLPDVDTVTGKDGEEMCVIYKPLMDDDLGHSKVCWLAWAAQEAQKRGEADHAG